MKDPYRVLGINRNAPQADIKSAYRRLVREYHPDRSPGDRAVEDRFKEVVAAYEQLSGKTRIDEESPRPGAGKGRDRWSGTNPFHAFYRKKQSEHASIRIDGSDVTYTLAVDFLEAAQGMTKRVSMATGKRLEVKVPAGTTDGQVLRLRGQGMTGLNGGKTGDALIEIKVKASPDYTVQGRDVYVDVPVTLPEAV
ncbi:MAG: DnaJ domain-containing protein, partial [Rhodospirillales bacterium]|nr:DnaJ domain-containing protein [Rhodospirillales bacterium]